jgi:hypothetical protein
MQSMFKQWLLATVLAGLVLAGASLAQPPGLKEGPPKGPASSVSVDDVTERIMAFDKNKDGKVTRDELPDRMHHLIELGDTNKDGALDRDEVWKMAAKVAAISGVFGGGPVRIGPGPGPGPGAGVRGGFGIGNAVRFPPDAVEGVVEDLKLSGKKMEQAMAAVKAHQENVHRLMDQARAELLEKMKEALSAEEFEDFKAALNRPRVGTFFNVQPRDKSRGGGPKQLDPPQK